MSHEYDLLTAALIGATIGASIDVHDATRPIWPSAGVSAHARVGAALAAERAGRANTQRSSRRPARDGRRGVAKTLGIAIPRDEIRRAA